MILFVRHGETEYNKLNMMQGRCDIPLNEIGIKQAKQTAKILKNKSIDIIYSSPLSRAKQTAEIINEYHNKEILVDERINEIDIGNLEKTPRIHHIIDKLQEKEFAKQHHAEDFNTFYDRCVDFFNSIVNSNKNILIVAHSGVGYQLKKYLNLNEEQLIKNCEVIVLKK